MDEKTRLIEELDAARADFWQVVDALDDDVEIYPGWKKREMLAHLAGWDALIWGIFRDVLAGTPLKPYDESLKNIDSANARFIAEHQGATVASARLECDLNRFAVKILLETIPPDTFVTQEVQFPWGKETFALWTQGAINHENRHGGDMRKLLESGTTQGMSAK